MKWVWFTALSALFAMAFFACSNPIEPKGGEDDLALLNYGSFNEDGMKSLVKGAMADCQEDPACKAAMEKADGKDLPVEEESSSSVAADTTSEEGASSSSTKGPIIASSGSVQPNISSSAGSNDSTAVSSASIASSGSTIVSSSSKGSSILNGACNATPTSVERGGSVTWKYVSLNSNLTIESYDWTFDEGSSITTSKDATPSVSYEAKGSYGASVTINKGLDTEKTVKCTTPVTVTGIKVTGCTCSATATSVVVSSSKPKDVTWTVSGCSGAGPFTYAWSGGASGTETSASMTISTVGSHAPKVTVTNSDGETMSPSCATVTASEMPGAACYVGEHDYDANKTSLSLTPGKSFYFKPGNVTGVTGTMSMTLAGGGSSKTISVTNGTNNSATSLTAPSDVGTFPYTLSVDGEEVCSATLTTSWPKITTTCTINKSTGGFSLGSFSGWDANAIGQNISVTMYRNDEVVGENLSINAYYNPSPWKTVSLPTVVGDYTYRLDYKGNTVCSVNYNVSLQKPSCNIGGGSNPSGSSYTAIPGQPFYFMPGNSNISSAKDMSLSFNNGTQTINVKPTSNSSTQLEAPAAFGTYPITLSDGGETMCTATLTVDYPKPSCNIGNSTSPSSASYTAIPGETFYFKPGNTSFVGEIGMTYTFNGSSEDITLLPSNNDAISLTAPEDLGTYPVTLKHGNNQACSATLTVDYPKPSCNLGKTSSAVSSSSINVLPGQTAYFKPGNSSFTGSIGMTYAFNGTTEDVTLLPSNNAAISLVAPDDPGEYPVTLSYGSNQACEATLTVEDPADYVEETAAGTYTGKIKFVNTKTCGVSASSNSWADWILDGTVAGNWGSSGQIRGTLYMSIPDGSTFTISSNCW